MASELNRLQEQTHELEKQLDNMSEEVLICYQEINLLYRVAEILSMETDPVQIARVVIEEVVQQIPSKRASLMMLDKDQNLLTVMAAKGLPAELGEHPKVRLGDSILQEVVLTKEAMLVNDLRDYPHLAKYLKGRGYETFSMLSVPLLSVPAVFKEEILGTINLSDKEDEKKIYTSRDKKLLSALASQAAIAFKRIELYKDLKRSEKETEEAFYYLVGTLARAAEAADEGTGNHIVRVGRYAQTLCRSLGLPEKLSEEIYHFAQMHDVGKIHIPHEILTKPGKLTEEEWQIIQAHTTKGAEILGDSAKLALARDIALSHHERWDGTGYPNKIKGEEITLPARIAMLADIYDALRNERPYKPAFDHDKTYAIITEGDGRTEPHHFDPGVLEAFKQVHQKFAEIHHELQD